MKNKYNFYIFIIKLNIENPTEKQLSEIDVDLIDVRNRTAGQYDYMVISYNIENFENSIKDLSFIEYYHIYKK